MTTDNACQRTSSATPWCLVATEATSQKEFVEGKWEAAAESPPDIVRSGATTAGVDRTRSPAAAATVAAMARTRNAVPFVVSMPLFSLFSFLFPLSSLPTLAATEPDVVDKSI